MTLEYFATAAHAKISLSSKRGHKITRLLAGSITKDLRPVAVVEGEGFKLPTRTLDPGYIVPSRKPMMMVLKGMKEDVLSKLQLELSAVINVLFTV